MLPGPASRALSTLGSNLCLARKRRKESLASFAERMQVSVPTLQKMEKGDPTVSIGVYASALWLIGRAQFLGMIADPATDETALMLELHNLTGKKRGP
jgi:transcriptional regulator with XRE-family HTH domain